MPEKFPVKYSIPLYMNRLQGRMLFLPSKARPDQNILIVYDRFHSLEKIWPLAKAYAKYGNVAVTDLPGFGGMESFYKIHDKPSTDRLADYLAAFIKLRYKRKQVVIVGIGFGFVIVTRMLQRYPDLRSRTKCVVNIHGHTHHSDFKMGPIRKGLMSLGGRLGSTKSISFFIRLGSLQNAINIQNASPDTVKSILTNMPNTWLKQGLRTYYATIPERVGVNNTEKTLKIPLWNLQLTDQNDYDMHTHQQHLQVVYSEYHELDVNLSPSELHQIDTKVATKLIPSHLKHMLDHS